MPSYAPEPQPSYGSPRPSNPWTWQLLPEGLIYRSYLAGVKEPRLGVQWYHEKDSGEFWDATLGGRVGLIRYGTTNALRPQGWQLDVEGAAFPRLDLDEEHDVVATDFRAGVPITYGRGNWEWKLAYYHLSAHAGDEFLLKNPGFVRINYSRDVIVWGVGWRPNDSLRFYGEAGWAFVYDDCEPWEFQFGAEYSPLRPTGFRGSPFAAVNAHLHEEVDFGGRLTAQAGWQWRGGRAGHLLRLGVSYLNGMSPQYEFLGSNEEQIGAGLWYDF